MLATALRSVHWHISTSVTSCGCRCPTELFGDDLDTAISKPQEFPRNRLLTFLASLFSRLRIVAARSGSSGTPGSFLSSSWKGHEALGFDLLNDSAY